jgi:hypothetical protein
MSFTFTSIVFKDMEDDELRHIYNFLQTIQHNILKELNVRMKKEEAEKKNG